MSDLFEERVPPPDARGQRAGAMARRVLVALFLAAVVLALLDLIGQQPSDSTATVPSATLRLSAPRTVRGGLIFQGRIEVRARRQVSQPMLTLARGWFEGMQVQSIEPDPSNQSSGQGGAISLSYDRLQAGQTLTVWVQATVDPTYVGDRDADVSLADGPTTLATVHHHITVLP